VPVTPWWCVPSVFCKWAGPVRFAYNLPSTRDPIPFPSASHSPSHPVDHLQEPAKRGDGGEVEGARRGGDGGFAGVEDGLRQARPQLSDPSVEQARPVLPRAGRGHGHGLRLQQ